MTFRSKNIHSINHFVRNLSTFFENVLGYYRKTDEVESDRERHRKEPMISPQRGQSCDSRLPVNSTTTLKPFCLQFFLGPFFLSFLRIPSARWCYRVLRRRLHSLLVLYVQSVLAVGLLLAANTIFWSQKTNSRLANLQDTAQDNSMNTVASPCY